jgi:hypothetical protein
MKLTKVQSEKTKEIIQYRVNDIPVCKHTYHEELDRHLSQRVGCYNSSVTRKSKRGNYVHVCYLSI